MQKFWFQKIGVKIQNILVSKNWCKNTKNFATNFGVKKLVQKIQKFWF